MSLSWLENSSFLYGDTDMWAVYGLQITNTGFPQDSLLPPLRSRKVTIPLRSGAYDYGAKYYDEKIIPCTCVTTRLISRGDFREMAYTLSQKQKIIFWDEPDKYYIGQVYESPTLEQLRAIGVRFPLSFVVEPFAYGADVSGTFKNTKYEVAYTGTEAAPTVITIKNTGETTINNITITQLRVRG